MVPITVVEYDPEWPGQFEEIRARVALAVGDAVVAIEHVGSTAVPGLCARPVIDISVVVEDAVGVSRAIDRLATLGYRHRGNLGIEGREAFRNPPDSPPHHLYVCPQGSLGLRNHLAVRDYLRTHPEAVTEYGDLKKDLAIRHGNNMDAYIDGKTDFLLRILAGAGITPAELESIAESNRAK